MSRISLGVLLLTSSAACGPAPEPASDDGRVPEVLLDSMAAPSNPIERGAAPARHMAEQADSAIRERERAVQDAAASQTP